MRYDTRKSSMIWPIWNEAGCANADTRYLWNIAGHFCNWGRSLAGHLFNCSTESAPFATTNETYVQSPVWFLTSELLHTSFDIMLGKIFYVLCNLSGQNHLS